MRNLIRIIFMLALTFLFVSNALSQRRAEQPVEFKKISDRLFEIAGGRGAQGVAYIGEDGVLLIDSKTDKESVEKVIEGIKQITDKPTKYLANTHSDGDHISGNRYFSETVTIVAHENCRKDFFLPGRNGAASE